MWRYAVLCSMAQDNTVQRDARRRCRRPSAATCYLQAQGRRSDPVLLDRRLPRIIIQRTDTTQTFSATFKGQSATAGSDGTSPALKLSYSAEYSGLETYSFNTTALSNTTSVAWDLGSPEELLSLQSRELCRQLLLENPGILTRPQPSKTKPHR